MSKTKNEKIAIITDTHFGAKQDSIYFQEYIEKFYNEVFFPYLDKNKIKRVIHLGDVFDKRKSVNYKTLKHFEDSFIEPLINRNINLVMITGNHDCFYKDTNQLNSLEVLLCSDEREKYSSIEIFSECVEYGDILLVPWINKENQESTFEKIKNTNSKYCFGHLEVQGFSMYKGYESRGGISKDLFSKFDMVLSGHYHTKSTKGNITYLGAPYEITWNDWDDPRGFHVFENGKLEYIQNEISLFEKIFYNDEDVNYNKYKLDSCEGKYVKVVVSKKNDVDMFDSFIDKIYKTNPIDVVIDEDFSYNILDDDFDESEYESTIQVLDGYIDSIDVTQKDKKIVKSLFKELYAEALENE